MYKYNYYYENIPSEFNIIPIQINGLAKELWGRETAVHRKISDKFKNAFIVL